MEAIHCSIDPLQYIAVLIIFSIVCPHYDQHGQATLVPRTYDAVTATELCTVIPVRQLGSLNKLLRSPGPTEALIIEASFCVFVHLDPHFGYKSQMNITFDCVRLHSFERA